MEKLHDNAHWSKQQQDCSEVFRLLSVQRHDFLNHLQVIMGLLQIKKYDRALTYIEELNHGALASEKLLEYHGCVHCPKDEKTL